MRELTICSWPPLKWLSKRAGKETYKIKKKKKSLCNLILEWHPITFVVFFRLEVTGSSPHAKGEDYQGQGLKKHRSLRAILEAAKHSRWPAIGLHNSLYSDVCLKFSMTKSSKTKRKYYYLKLKVRKHFLCLPKLKKFLQSSKIMEMLLNEKTVIILTFIDHLPHSRQMF